MRYSERKREGLRLPSREDLKYFHAMPLEVKVGMTKTRIREWVKEYGTDGVYVSFSGGKDSTVLLHIVRELYPNVEAVFVDTGLEYPEIRDFVKTVDNVTWLRPEMNFKKVIETYGYPLVSKEISKQYRQLGVEQRTPYLHLTEKMLPEMKRSIANGIKNGSLYIKAIFRFRKSVAR
jgi:3'-phosphoadenosine 5'-phosphosulfate sulfotransferase (PAPS reductase)/FAD synthetase